MKGFLAKAIQASLILIGSAGSVCAQIPIDSQKPYVSKRTTPVLGLQPVSVEPLPNIGPDTIGITNAEGGLSLDVWKGTRRDIAERLLSALSPSSSDLLNDLVLRLLRSSVVPPEGAARDPQKYLSLRLEKLALFGDSAAAWSLAKRAGVKAVDPETFKVVAGNALIDGNEDFCAQTAEFSKLYPKVDFQEVQIVCRLKAKDVHAAQVAVDVLESGRQHNEAFVDLAQSILRGNKTLPAKLTPATPGLVALLQVSGLPLPDSFYAQADLAYAHALSGLPARNEAAKLAYIERAAERGFIGKTVLADAYRAAEISPNALAAPLASSETGPRLRALLFRAAESAGDTETKIALVSKFVQSATPALTDAAGDLLGAMLGDIDPAAAPLAHAPLLARVYMFAGKDDLALAWIAAGKSDPVASSELRALWPQFALNGYENESSYASNFDAWLDQVLKNADVKTARDIVVPTLLFLNAAEMEVTDEAWQKVLSVPKDERKTAFSSLLYEKLRVAANGHRQAETIVLAAELADGGEISLPVALRVTAALRQAGFEGESDYFARQAVAALTRGK